MIYRTIALGWRQMVLFVALLAFSGLIARKLVYWQVTEHTRMVQVAVATYGGENTIPARRGTILDTHLTPLVSETPSYEVAVDPQSIATRLDRYYAAKLGRVLHRDPGVVLGVLQTPYVQWVPLAHAIDLATYNAIRALTLPDGSTLPGIILTQSYRDSYPQPNDLAAPLLGFINENGQGYGLEAYYNPILAGRDGTRRNFVDTANNKLLVGVAPERRPVNGADIVLTIDARIQSVVEARVAAAIKRYGAESGTGIVMDPKTGQILAMASLPSFDPNHYNLVGNPAYYNNLTVMRYQPGSTFKVISVSAGIDSGTYGPTDTVFDAGYYVAHGMTVRNWDVGKGWGMETPQTMLRYSANVGMAEFTDKVYPPTFYNYVVDRFGFNAPTGITLPNESAGSVRTPDGNDYWLPEDLLTNSYGQGIDVTPLQLVTAVAALANHGQRMRPYLVKSVIYSDGRRQDTHPQVIKQAVSPATAQTMTTMLSNSAYEGEAMCALTRDYPVAAKTGTATIEPPNAHGLNLNLGTVASLVGYAPANDPRFVMLITLRHPQPGPTGNNIYGSVVAAPAWHDIAVRLYGLMNILPQPGSTPADLTWKQGPRDYNCGFMPQP